MASAKFRALFRPRRYRNSHGDHDDKSDAIRVSLAHPALADGCVPVGDAFYRRVDGDERGELSPAARNSPAAGNFDSDSGADPAGYAVDEPDAGVASDGAAIRTHDHEAV